MIRISIIRQLNCLPARKYPTKEFIFLLPRIFEKRICAQRTSAGTYTDQYYDAQFTVVLWFSLVGHWLNMCSIASRLFWSSQCVHARYSSFLE